jgi:hypothetical protein
MVGKRSLPVNMFISVKKNSISHLLVILTITFISLPAERVYQACQWKNL